MGKVNVFVALFVGALFAGSAQAETPVVGAAYLDEMARLDAEVAVLRKRQELKQTQELSHPVVPSRLPKVLATYTSGGRLVAEIQYENGLVTRVGGGESIPGGLTVVSVNSKGVTIRDSDKKKSVLDFVVRTGQAAAQAQSVAAPSAMAAVPVR